MLHIHHDEPPSAESQGDTASGIGKKTKARLAPGLFEREAEALDKREGRPEGHVAQPRGGENVANRDSTSAGPGRTHFLTPARRAAKARDLSIKAAQGHCANLVRPIIRHQSGPWSPDARLLALHIASVGWSSWVGVARLATEIGKSERTVNRALKEIAAAPGNEPGPFDIFERRKDHRGSGDRTSDIWATSPQRLGLLKAHLDAIDQREARRLLRMHVGARRGRKLDRDKAIWNRHIGRRPNDTRVLDQTTPVSSDQPTRVSEEYASSNSQDIVVQYTSYTAAPEGAADCLDERNPIGIADAPSVRSRQDAQAMRAPRSAKASLGACGRAVGGNASDRGEGDPPVGRSAPRNIEPGAEIALASRLKALRGKAGLRRALGSIEEARGLEAEAARLEATQDPQQKAYQTDLDDVRAVAAVDLEAKADPFPLMADRDLQRALERFGLFVPMMTRPQMCTALATRCQMTYMSQDDIFEIEERAAISEFEGGTTRAEAEAIAMRDAA